MKLKKMLLATILAASINMASASSVPTTKSASYSASFSPSNTSSPWFWVCLAAWPGDPFSGMYYCNEMTD